jgi:hypothetical protein
MMLPYADMLRRACWRTRLAYWCAERRWYVLGFLLVAPEDKREFAYRDAQDPRH